MGQSCAASAQTVFEALKKVDDKKCAEVLLFLMF